MKRERHGKAKILTPEEIQLLFNQGLQTSEIALYSASASTPPVASMKPVPNSPPMPTITLVKSDPT